MGDAVKRPGNEELQPLQRPDPKLLAEPKRFSLPRHIATRIPPTADLFEMDDSGKPAVNAYTLILSNYVLRDDILIRSDQTNSHMSCTIQLMQHLTEKGIKRGSLETMELERSMVALVVGGEGKDIVVGVRADKEMNPAEWRLKNTAATEALVRIGVPREKIKIFSLDKGVFEEFEKRGELWMIYPPPVGKEREMEFIRNYQGAIAKTESDEGARIYYNPGSGGRFITLNDFGRVIGGFESGEMSRDDFIRRMSYITRMMNQENRGQVRELSFFGTVDDGYRNEMAEIFEALFGVKVDELTPADELFKMAITSNVKNEEIMARYRTFEDALQDTLLSPTYTSYNPEDNTCREMMYRSLQSIPVDGEMVLGLSKVYVGDIVWMPGATVETPEEGAARLRFHEGVDQQTSAIIGDYFSFFQRKGKKLTHINVGRDIMSHSKSRKMHPDEHREVYVVEYRVEGEAENRLDLLRRQKWDKRHYLEGMEFPLDQDMWGRARRTFLSKSTIESLEVEGVIERGQDGVWMNVEGHRRYGRSLTDWEAQKLADEYTQYVFDRNLFERALMPGHPKVYEKMDLPAHEDDTGETVVPFFIRPYISGVAADKMPDWRFADVEFGKKIASVMAVEAARNLAVGRRNPFTKKIIYWDGDEFIQFSGAVEDQHSEPTGLIRGDSTAVLGDNFANTATDFIEAFSEEIIKLLKTSREKGVSDEGLIQIQKSFVDSFRGATQRLKGVRALMYEYANSGEVTSEEREKLMSLFSNSTPTMGEERYEWPRCAYLVPQAITRMEGQNPDYLAKEIENSEALRSFWSTST